MMTFRKRPNWTIWPVLVALTLTLTLIAIRSNAHVQEAVFLVHYAEGNPSGTELTKTGKMKAQALARELEDAGIDVIYAVNRPYTVLTAEPTAKALNVKINEFGGKNFGGPAAIDAWTRQLPTEHANQRVLVVTGANSGRLILKGLGVPDKEIVTRRTDNLFLIIPRGSDEPKVIKLRW